MEAKMVATAVTDLPRAVSVSRESVATMLEISGMIAWITCDGSLTVSTTIGRLK